MNSNDSTVVYYEKNMIIFPHPCVNQTDYCLISFFNTMMRLSIAAKLRQWKQNVFTCVEVEHREQSILYQSFNN